MVVKPDIPESLRAVMSKKCTRCKLKIILSGFSKVSKNRDGLDHVCRECHKKEGFAGIYKITSPSGAVYIGQSRKIHNRFVSYRNLECKQQRRLYNSFCRHGVKNHTFDVAHHLPKDAEQRVLDTYELLYWQQYKDCGIEMLNLKEPGIGPGKLCEESRSMISKSQKGRVGTTKNREDLTGRIFNKLTVISFHKSYKRSESAITAAATWFCKCECGKTTIVKAGNLRSGAVKSCGCLRNEPAATREDLTGRIFGRWTVIRFGKSIKNGVKWLCRCECGTEKMIVPSSLKSGGVTV
jgi:group I intron endonuclease